MQNTPGHSSKLVSRSLGRAVGALRGPHTDEWGFDEAALAFAGARRTRRRPNLWIRVTTAGAAVKDLIRGPRPERGTHESLSRHTRRRGPDFGRMWSRSVAASRRIHIDDRSAVVLCRSAESYRRGR